MLPSCCKEFLPVLESQLESVLSTHLGTTAGASDLDATCRSPFFFGRKYNPKHHQVWPKPIVLWPKPQQAYRSTFPKFTRYTRSSALTSGAPGFHLGRPQAWRSKPLVRKNRSCTDLQSALGQPPHARGAPRGLHHLASSQFGAHRSAASTCINRSRLGLPRMSLVTPPPEPQRQSSTWTFGHFRHQTGTAPRGTCGPPSLIFLDCLRVATPRHALRPPESVPKQPGEALTRRPRDPSLATPPRP